MRRLLEFLLVVVLSVPMTGCGPRPPEVSPAVMEAQIDAAEQRLRQAQTAEADNAQPIASRKKVDKGPRAKVRKAVTTCEGSISTQKCGKWGEKFDPR